MSDCRFGVSPVNYPDPVPDPQTPFCFIFVNMYISNINIIIIIIIIIIVICIESTNSHNIRLSHAKALDVSVIYRKPEVRPIISQW